MLEKNFEWHKMLNAGIERNDSKDDQQVNEPSCRC